MLDQAHQFTIWFPPAGRAVAFRQPIDGGARQLPGGRCEEEAPFGPKKSDKPSGAFPTLHKSSAFGFGALGRKARAKASQCDDEIGAGCTGGTCTGIGPLGCRSGSSHVVVSGMI